jgi:hypothetical protein
VLGPVLLLDQKEQRHAGRGRCSLSACSRSTRLAAARAANPPAIAFVEKAYVRAVGEAPHAGCRPGAVAARAQRSIWGLCASYERVMHLGEGLAGSGRLEFSWNSG